MLFSSLSHEHLRAKDAFWLFYFFQPHTHTKLFPYLPVNILVHGKLN